MPPHLLASGRGSEIGLPWLFVPPFCLLVMEWAVGGAIVSFYPGSNVLLHAYYTILPAVCWVPPPIYHHPYFHIIRPTDCDVFCGFAVGCRAVIHRCQPLSVLVEEAGIEPASGRMRRSALPTVNTCLPLYTQGYELSPVEYSCLLPKRGPTFFTVALTAHLGDYAGWESVPVQAYVAVLLFG